MILGREGLRIAKPAGVSSFVLVAAFSHEHNI